MAVLPEGGPFWSQEEWDRLCAKAKPGPPLVMLWPSSKSGAADPPSSDPMDSPKPLPPMPTELRPPAEHVGKIQHWVGTPEEPFVADWLDRPSEWFIAGEPEPVPATEMAARGYRYLGPAEWRDGERKPTRVEWSAAIKAMEQMQDELDAARVELIQLREQRADDARYLTLRIAYANAALRAIDPTGGLVPVFEADPCGNVGPSPAYVKYRDEWLAKHRKPVVVGDRFPARALATRESGVVPRGEVGFGE